MEPISTEKFGAFVLQLRKGLGLTQKELGERLFISDKTVSKWERGLSLPSVELLLPLAETLGVTVTELLKGERVQTETLPIQEVEQLVGRTLELSSGERERRRQDRRRWARIYVLCAATAVCELIALVALGCSLEQMSSSAILIVGLLLFFGGWFCLGAPETLPTYYDEHSINYVTDGVFRIHVSGMRFNNSNWPHIVHNCRVYSMTVAVAYPVLYLLLEFTGFNQSFLPSLFLTLAVSLGIIVPIYVTGKKYE